MARKLRIQFEGAIYHVINRGNYRRDLFENANAKASFESCLLDAADRFKWKLHAFSLLRNHFHLVPETEHANLSEGMQWLQVTHAVRFNRFRNERGHLFQGRFKAILIENGASLARVVNYVHLNPVEAKIVEPEQIAEYRWSSLYHFLRQNVPLVLSAKDWLAELRSSGVDDIHGYVSYLQTLARDREEQKRQGWAGMNHGWAIGTQGWRETLARE